MNKATIYCDDCGNEYKMDIEYASDVFGIRCRFCNSEHTWITNMKLEANGNKVELGNGGCGAPND